MKISIAMTTFNGAKYLPQQLNSFIKQSRLPDELVVCDDGSSDDSMDILEDFKKAAPFSMIVHRNHINLGSSLNFEKSINLCSGDIILLSDQDDVWLPHKTKILSDELDAHPRCNYVFSDALITDHLLRPLGYTMWDLVKFSKSRRVKFIKGNQVEVLLKNNVVTGATMAFRSELKRLISPISDLWVHDAWIAMLSSAADSGGRFIELPLIYYRQHDTQQIGGRKSSFISKIRVAKRTGSEAYLNECGRIHAASFRLKEKKELDPKSALQFDRKISHLMNREVVNASSLSGKGKIFKDLVRCRYHVYSDGWSSAIKDLFL